MNKDIIGIFGGTGFLGMELVSVLSKSGFQVKVFSRNASEEKSINLMGELTIKGKSQNIPINIEVIKLASELVQVKSEISFSRNDFKIGTGNWKNTTILKDKIKIKANIFLFKE